MRTFDVPKMRRAPGRQGLENAAAPVASRRPSSALLVACVLSIVVTATSERATAQQAQKDDPFAGVEEMIVTGSGTAALLAPTSTQAISFDSGDLEAYGVEDISDIAAQVPNLEIRSSNATNASFFVRGVGLQDFGANASSSVPIFQDNVPRNPSATQLTGLYDVGGLSVLKGPQGTGNYRNASAGAFIVKSAQPEPEFSGFARTSIQKIVSVDAHDANRYTSEMGMNIPIFEDIISARISARYAHENPFFENGCANRLSDANRPVYVRNRDVPTTPNGVGSLEEAQLCGETFQRAGDGGARTGISHVRPYLHKYLGEVDDFGFRGQLRIQPPDSGMDWVFRAELSRLNRDSTLGQNIGTGTGFGSESFSGYIDPDVTNRAREIEPGIRAKNPGLSTPEINRLVTAAVGRELFLTPLDEHPYRGDFDRPGKTILETHSASTTGLIDLDEINIEINAGFIDYRKSEGRDVDLTPNILFPSFSTDQAWEVYGDFTVSGETVGDLPLQWDAGAYTLVENVEATQRQQIFEVERTNQFTQEIYSFGVFAQGRYEFLEAFTLAAGIRFNWEQKDFKVQNRRSGTVEVLEGSSNQRTWDSWTGMLELRYDFTEEIASYIKYTRGFKAGHFNPSRPQQAKVPGQGFADPEKIDAFEWGVDFSAWQSRINGTAALFFYNYSDYQVFRLTSTQAGVFRTVENAEEAQNWGIEVELTATPLEGFVPEAIEGLRINLRFGLLETKFINFTVAEDRLLGTVGVIGVAINYSGNPLLNAPNMAVSGTLTWPLQLGRFGTLTPQYDFSWSDDIPFDPNNGRGEIDTLGQSTLPNYLVGNRAYILHNLRLTWEPPGGESQFAVSGWCRNVADERYKTFSVDLSTFAASQLIFVADPRICGADIRFNF